MSERKWTPGPWAIDFSSVISKAEALPAGRVHGYGCGNDFVADLNDGEYHEYTDRDEQDANACLIAAAPEMYEALERAAKWIESGHDGIGPLLRQCHAALAKARGEA